MTCMLQNRVIESQIQFLQEANENLNTLDSVLLELKANHQISLQNINSVLRATHLIKYGANIRGFRLLSDFAHRLEDSLKILKTRTNSLENDTELHNLLLAGIDWLRQIVKLLSDDCVVDEQWLVTFCLPIFEEIQQYLNHSIFVPANGLQDVILLVFQTEVEEYLQRLEYLLTNGEIFIFKAEITMIAVHLISLGEILQLKDFTHLCQSIKQHLETAISNTEIAEIAQLTLLTLRRSQALILTRKLDSLFPNTLDRQKRDRSPVDDR
ncbi:MAG: Hpt domain-containing protein [Fischerella sp.]|nr:Hpt domain-containing protein [Fischerella sp.]